MSKAENTKAFIIEKTAPLFNKKGYAGTSMSDLTEATGLTKGALYGNFKNKDEIALAAFDFNTRFVRNLMQLNTAAEPSAIKRLLMIPDYYQNCFKDLAGRGGCPILNTAVEADDNHPALKKKVNAAILSWKKNLEVTIQQGIDSTEIKAGINPASYAALFISLFEGGIMLSKSTGDLSFINESVQRMRTIILSELKR